MVENRTPHYPVSRLLESTVKIHHSHNGHRSLLFQPSPFNHSRILHSDEKTRSPFGVIQAQLLDSRTSSLTHLTILLYHSSFLLSTEFVSCRFLLPLVSIVSAIHQRETR